MNWKWDDTFNLALIGLLTLLAVVLYPSLPDPVPTHWNMQGEADGYTPKPWGAFIGPVITLATWAVLRVLPFISPKGFRIEAFMRVFRIIVLSTMVFLALTLGVALLVAAGLEIGISRFVLGATGVLLIVLGNYLGKVRRNFFVGIRTPWTLASEEVWYRTHRLGGWLFVLGGAVLVLAALADWGMLVLIPTLVVAALGPVLYSLWLYYRIEGFGSGS